MNKLMKSSLAAVLALGLVGCSGSTPATDGGTTDGGDEGSKITIGFVTDKGGIDDKSFNQTTYKGIVQFAEENGLKEGTDYSYLQSNTDADYTPNLTQFADEQVDLEVAAGYLFEGAVNDTVKQYPDQKILIIDVGWLEDSPNLQQAVFAEHEGSFLVGVVAGLKAIENGSKHVGMVIGMKSDSMFKFWAGFQQGVWAVCPDCIISFDSCEDFAAPEKGKTLAQKQFNNGATVIFSCAGASGNGVIQEGAERRGNGEDVWVIGVDTDQYEQGIYEGSVAEGNEKSAILTSMMKRVDVAAYNACKQVAEGNFVHGVVNYTLADGGVSLPENNPNLTEDVLKTVDEWTQKIISGEVTVDSKAIETDDRIQ